MHVSSCLSHSQFIIARVLSSSYLRSVILISYFFIEELIGMNLMLLKSYLFKTQNESGSPTV